MSTLGARRPAEIFSEQTDSADDILNKQSDFIFRLYEWGDDELTKYIILKSDVISFPLVFEKILSKVLIPTL